MPIPKLIFYDIKTLIPGLPTSQNCWRARLVLNYKGLPYETVWTEGPDIANACIAAGIPPLEKCDDGSPRYTLPALVDFTKPEAPVLLSDSRKIIDYLESAYPSPDPRRVLFPPGSHAFQLLADNHFERTVLPIATRLAIYRMQQLQPECSRPPFEKYAPPGKTLAEADPRGQERTELWARLREELDKLAGFAEGKMSFSGDELRYFDLHVLAALLAIKLSVGDEEFEKELGRSAEGRWTRLVKACEELVR